MISSGCKIDIIRPAFGGTGLYDDCNYLFFNLKICINEMLHLIYVSKSARILIFK